MRVLITGAGGLLGQALVDQFQPHHHVIGLRHQDADVTCATSLEQIISRAAPDVVVHCAAFTAVDECERFPEKAFDVNAEGTANVARACGRARIPVLYVSTDYVFDGEKTTPYVETDAPHPLNVYGQSKLEGERATSQLDKRFWIVRTSSLFWTHGRHFVRAILDQARQGKALRVVSDQVSSPTFAPDLAQKIAEIVERAGPGTFHVTNTGSCSWFEFARAILREAGLETVPIAPISTWESGRPARRPRNSRLANIRLLEEGFSELPPWQDALRRCLLSSGGGS